jgi:hypothetical protein
VGNGKETFSFAKEKASLHSPKEREGNEVTLTLCGTCRYAVRDASLLRNGRYFRGYEAGTKVFGGYFKIYSNNI